MTEAQMSFVRSLLKILGAALVTKGVMDADQAVALQAALEAVLGGAITLVGMYLSHRKHKVE